MYGTCNLCMHNFFHLMVRCDNEQRMPYTDFINIMVCNIIHVLGTTGAVLQASYNYLFLLVFEYKVKYL